MLFAALNCFGKAGDGIDYSLVSPFSLNSKSDFVLLSVAIIIDEPADSLASSSMDSCMCRFLHAEPEKVPRDGVGVLGKTI